MYTLIDKDSGVPYNPERTFPTPEDADWFRLSLSSPDSWVIGFSARSKL